MADHFLVIAWTDLEKKKRRDHSGLSAFIVERAFKGFSSYTMKEKWGILAGNTGGFHMADVEVPVENRVGDEGEGFKVAMFALENGRYTVAAGATGLIRACLDASVRYAKERKTFGVPIGEHQLVKEMIAEMVSDYDAARLLWLRAGWLKNQGQAQQPRDVPRQVVRHREERAGRLGLRPDPRRQRLLRRVPGRPLLPQLARPP